MAFKLEKINLHKSETGNIIPPGELQYLKSFKRSGTTREEGEDVRIHRVYTDKDGRQYFELLSDPKTQYFVYNLLKDLGYTPVVKYKDEKNKIIFLSLLPIETDFTAEPSGAILGWANIFLLSLVFSDEDHILHFDYDFLKDNFTNINIFLGNIMVYDFGESFAYDYMPSARRAISSLQRDVNGLEEVVKSSFRKAGIVDHEEGNNFYINVLIHLRAKLEQLKVHVSELGVEGIDKLVAGSESKNIKKIFTSLPKEFTTEDFLFNLKFKIDLVDKVVLGELTKTSYYKTRQDL